ARAARTGPAPVLLDFRLAYIRPPPRQALSPYTTLFRSTPRKRAGTDAAAARPSPRAQSAPESSARIASSRASRRQGLRRSGRPRSEEHTSELQSRENLVCRLLLEKKKQVERAHGATRDR